MLNQIPYRESKCLLIGFIANLLMSCTAGSGSNPSQLTQPFKVLAADKMTICHLPPGNPENAQTISIAPSAWATHLEHGDKEGECPTPSPTPVESTVSSSPTPEQTVSVMPTPTVEPTSSATPEPLSTPTPIASATPTAEPTTAPPITPVAKSTKPMNAIVRMPILHNVRVAPPKFGRMVPPPMHRMMPRPPMQSMTYSVRVNVLFLGDMGQFEDESCHESPPYGPHRGDGKRR